MLYRFANGHVIFKDPNTMKEYSFDLPGVKEIDFVTTNKDGTLTTFSAFDFDDTSIGIFICNLVNEHLEQIYNKKSYDIVFDNTGNKLYFNSGNTLHFIDLKSGTTSKLYKFCRIENAPISLSLNPEGDHISYEKWKSDSRRLYTYDLLNNKENDMKKSFFDYSWLDSEHIIHSLSNGVSILNIHTRKSEKIVRNFNTLIKKYSYSISNYAINSFKGTALIIDNISKPVFYDGRIYFEVFLSNDKRKNIGIYSIASDKTDLQCHFSSEQGLIRDFGLLMGGKIIYIFIMKNKLQNETINSGVIYISDNQIVDFEGWLPVKVPQKPTTFQIR